jgi:hypothetical protein
MCLLNRCGLWSVMYLSSNGIVVAFDRSCICLLMESLFPLNTWPITGHNDLTSTQIHDRSQATTVQRAHKYMTDHRQQRFNKHTNTWPITGHKDSKSTQIHDWLQDRCGLWSVMYLSSNGIVVAFDRSCICLLMESLFRPITGNNDSTSTQIHDR